MDSNRQKKLLLSHPIASTTRKLIKGSHALTIPKKISPQNSFRSGRAHNNERLGPWQRRRMLPASDISVKTLPSQVRIQRHSRERYFWFKNFSARRIPGRQRQQPLPSYPGGMTSANGRREEIHSLIQQENGIWNQANYFHCAPSLAASSYCWRRARPQNRLGQSLLARLFALTGSALFLSRDVFSGCASTENSRYCSARDQLFSWIGLHSFFLFGAIVREISTGTGGNGISCLWLLVGCRFYELVWNWAVTVMIWLVFGLDKLHFLL